MVLFHGAGGDRDHRLFLTLEEELGADPGIPVARRNFPYREKGPGRRPPDRMPRLIESIRAHVGDCCAAWGCEPGEVVLGGRSMGGRAASMAVAEGLPSAGLLLLSYPLHPPGQPDRLRVDHFGQLSLPVLVVQGSSDPFGKPPELAEHLRAIPGPVTHVTLDRTGHDPVERTDGTVVGAVRCWLGEV